MRTFIIFYYFYVSWKVTKCWNLLVRGFEHVVFQNQADNFFKFSQKNKGFEFLDTKFLFFMLWWGLTVIDWRSLQGLDQLWGFKKSNKLWELKNNQDESVQQIIKIEILIKIVLFKSEPWIYSNKKPHWKISDYCFRKKGICSKHPGQL